MTGPSSDTRQDRIPGRAAVEALGWWRAHRWLVLRRLSQASMILIFLIGPATGFWLVKGTLASSLTLDVLPLTDPLIALQALAANHPLELDALLGAAIVLAVYAAVGGRVYCSWVCPVNVLSDTAHWLRVRLGWTRTGVRFGRSARLWILGGVLVVSALGGVIAWEAVNPVTILHRGLVYGTLFTGGLAWMVLVGIFLVELVGGNRPWCSHLCPVGAFYGLVGTKSLLRVSAPRRAACDDCRDCYLVCPEGHVITPALKGDRKETPTWVGPVILSADCTNCGRCIDVCPQDVFEFGSRLRNRPEDLAPASREDAAREAA